MDIKVIANYLKIDEDIIEDDVLLQELVTAAIDYLQETTGKKYNADSKVMNIVICELVALWYENREPISTKTNVHELPHTLQALLTHISLASRYESIGDADA